MDSIISAIVNALLSSSFSMVYKIWLSYVFCARMKRMKTQSKELRGWAFGEMVWMVVDFFFFFLTKRYGHGLCRWHNAIAALKIKGVLDNMGSRACLRVQQETQKDRKDCTTVHGRSRNQVQASKSKTMCLGSVVRQYRVATKEITNKTRHSCRENRKKGRTPTYTTNRQGGGERSGFSALLAGGWNGIHQPPLPPPL